jgi:integrase
MKFTKGMKPTKQHFTKGMKPTKHKIMTAPPGRHYLGQGICLIVVAPKTEHGLAKRRWVYRYTKPKTKKVTETPIGSAYAFPYDEAFAQATRYRLLVLKDQDPVDVKRQKAASTTTFAEVSDEWFQRHKSWSESQKLDVTLRLTKHAQALATNAIAHIDVDMVEAAIKPLGDRVPKQARRTLNIWARVFTFAKNKRYCTGDNPATWEENLELRFPDWAKTKTRHYTSLAHQAVPEVVRRLYIRQPNSTAANALLFQIFTATRSCETLGAEWPEFDLPNRIWTVPAVRMQKTKKPHRVPLSSPAMALLAHQWEYRKSDQFVFTGRNRTSLDRKAMRLLLRDMEIKATPHGFRSSFRNWAAKYFKRDRDFNEMCLSHKVKTSVEECYWTEDALDERRPIMDAWGEYCEGRSTVLKVDQGARVAAAAPWRTP